MFHRHQIESVVGWISTVDWFFTIGFLPFWAIFTSAPLFCHFQPFLRVRHFLAILSYFYECATFLPIELSLREHSIFMPFWAIFTSALRFCHLKLFLRVRHFNAILNHFYECATFLPFWAILTTGPFFVILSHLYECVTLLTFLAIFTSGPAFCHIELFLRVGDFS